MSIIVGVLQKAKAENKYFKSMSDAEAKEKERKLAEQTMERYIVAWQSIKENEQALISKIVRTIFTDVHVFIEERIVGVGTSQYVNEGHASKI